MTSIFVGNLPYEASEDEIRQQFEAFGNVNSVKLLVHRDTGRPRGIGFVEMDDDAAQTAIKELNGKDMGGRPMRVDEARPREPRPPRNRW